MNKYVGTKILFIVQSFQFWKESSSPVQYSECIKPFNMHTYVHTIMFAKHVDDLPNTQRLTICTICIYCTCVSHDL